jgi:hypothetical protein
MALFLGLINFGNLRDSDKKKDENKRFYRKGMRHISYPSEPFLYWLLKTERDVLP